MLEETRINRIIDSHSISNKQELRRNKVMQGMRIITIQQTKDRIINISQRNKAMMAGKLLIHLVNSSNQKTAITITTAMEATTAITKERTIIIKAIIATIKGIPTTITAGSKVAITILTRVLLVTTYARNHSRTRKA